MQKRETSIGSIIVLSLLWMNCDLILRSKFSVLNLKLFFKVIIVIISMFMGSLLPLFAYTMSTTCDHFTASVKHGKSGVCVWMCPCICILDRYVQLVL